MKRYHIFPNESEDGHYDVLTQCIELYKLQRDHVKQIMSDPLNINHIKSYRILCHEIRHYFDSIATLKGIRLIRDIFNAYNSIECDKNSTETSNNIQIVYEKFLHMNIDDYYKVIDLDIDRYSKY